MSEKTDYKLIRTNWVNKKDRLERVENIMVRGMPDINFCVAGVEGWIEQKAMKREPVKGSTQLMGDGKGLSAAQKTWWRKHNLAGGHGFIFISTPRRFLLIPGSHSDTINQMTLRELIDVAVWESRRPVRRKNAWLDLREALKNE